MSGIVELREREDREREISELLGQLLNAEVIDGDVAQGIAKQVIDKGTESLSAKQRYVFEKEVEKPFFEPRCDRCGERITLAESWDIEAGDVASTCSGCKHDYESFMKV